MKVSVVVLLFAWLSLLLSACVESFAPPVLSTFQNEFLKSYQESLGPDFNVVEYGGWLKLERDAMVSNPKGALVSMIVDSMIQDDHDDDKKKKKKDEKASSSSSSTTLRRLDAKFQYLLELLQKENKGFSSDLVHGEWVSVLNKSGTSSPKIQKVVASTEKVGNAYANFDTSQSKFYGSAKFWNNRAEVQSTVYYTPVKEGYTIATTTTTSSSSSSTRPASVRGTVVLRRIMCDIVSASIKVWKLPRLSLPFLRRKGGYLDFIFLDSDIRVTKGNRGGIFVHFRPEFLRQQQQQV